MFQPFDRAQEFETTLQLVVNGYINGPSLRLRINWKKERADFGDEIDLHGNCDNYISQTNNIITYFTLKCT